MRQLWQAAWYLAAGTQRKMVSGSLAQEFYCSESITLAISTAVDTCGGRKGIGSRAAAVRPRSCGCIPLAVYGVMWCDEEIVNRGPRTCHRVPLTMATIVCAKDENGSCAYVLPYR